MAWCELGCSASSAWYAAYESHMSTAYLGVPAEEAILLVHERDAKRGGCQAGAPVPAEEGGAVAGNEARVSHVVLPKA